MQLSESSALRFDLGSPRREEDDASITISITSQSVHRVPVDGEPEIAARLAEMQKEQVWADSLGHNTNGSQLSLTSGQFSVAHHALGRRTTHIALAMGDATVQHALRDGAASDPALALAAAPHALETPASILELLDAIKLQQEERWKTARELATVQPLRKQYPRAARLLERFRVPLAKLPILPLTAKVFLGAVALQAILMIVFGGGLVVGHQDAAGCHDACAARVPAGDPLAGRRYFPSDPSSSNSSVFDAGACYHAAADAWPYHQCMRACKLGAAHEVYFGWISIVCAVVLLASSTTAIAVENPFELAFALCIGLLFFTIDASWYAFTQDVWLSPCKYHLGAYQAGKLINPDDDDETDFWEAQFSSGEDGAAAVNCTERTLIGRAGVSNRTESTRFYVFCVELLLAVAAIFLGVCVVRDFGWRVYRMFGASERGARIKEMYRKRMVFYACLLYTSPSPRD